jgi:rubrerythrin
MSATEFENRESVRQSVRELWCGSCGYGVVVRRDPPECPMCRETSWLERAPLVRYT